MARSRNHGRKKVRKHRLYGSKAMDLEMTWGVKRRNKESNKAAAALHEAELKRQQRLYEEDRALRASSTPTRRNRIW